MKGQSMHARILHVHDYVGGCLCESPLLARLNRWVSAELSPRSIIRRGGDVTPGVAASGTVQDSMRVQGSATSAADDEPSQPATPIEDSAGENAVLFRDVRVFDGVSPALSALSHVLVQGNVIQQITGRPITPSRGALVIDGGGRTLMPGLIDAHAHPMFAGLPLLDLLTADIGYINLVAGKVCGDMLSRGFTSVRDMQGPVFGLKRAIDTGLMPGPRIFPSGAMISQTSGHGDFRMLAELPRNPAAPLSQGETWGASAIADGVDAVLRAAREQLMRGASQLKLAGGGGVASNYGQLDVVQYSEAEIRAAVGAADDWNTYVAVHAYTPRAIQRALAAGVRSIEHGHLADDASAKLMAEKDVWWSLQPFTTDFPVKFPEGSPNALKLQAVQAGTDTAYGLAKKYKVKTAWGADILFDAAAVAFQNTAIVNMTRWYGPAEVLKMATADNAELLALSGPRNPYPGRLGVVQGGALADLLLVDGDPLEDLSLLGDPEKNLFLVMKDGQIYKQAPAVTAARA
jgi:imidazolonepropionase-like amidohydrolase